ARPGAASAADAPVVRRDSVTGAIESIRSDRTGLTAPSKGAPADLALAFVRARAKDFGLHPGHARNLYVAKELTLTSCASAIHVGQQVGGLRVNDALLTVVVAADGRVLSAAGHLAAGAVGASASGAPALNARQALDKAAGAQGA